MSEPQLPPPGAAPPAVARRRGGKYLTFQLAAEEYGLEILKVQEILGLLPITRVPGTPPFIRGVLNLRGKVIPIMDLRGRFAMPPAEAGATSIIVVQARALVMGLLVDRVSEVADIAEADIEDAPSFGVAVDTAFLLGIGKTQGHVRLLLDIDEVLSSSEADAVRTALPDAA